MTLQEILKELSLLVDSNEKEWINIIYANAWEFQFRSRKFGVTVVAKTPQDDLIALANELLLKVQKLKS